MEAVLKFLSFFEQYGGKTSIEKVCELTHLTPLREEVEAMYDAEKESTQK